MTEKAIISVSGKRRHREQPSREWLDEFLYRARRYGWTGDYVEIRNFVRLLFHDAGVALTDEQLEPFPDEE